MINFIKTNKTFASFVLFTCILTSPVGRIGCFFAPAEIQFALEIVSMLRNSASIQSLSESVCDFYFVCLLDLSLFSVLCIILVPACVAGLVLMRFCARTVAEMALLALKSLCSTMWALFGRRAAVCFVLFPASGCTYREAVLLAKNTEFPVRLETPSLTLFRPVAPVLGATGKPFDLKRKHRVIFRVSFVFILFLVLIGVVVAACGGARWIATSAVGLSLLLAELRRSSAAAAKSSTHIVQLWDLETSSSFALDRICLVREFEFRRRSTQSTQQSASKQEVRSVEHTVRRRRVRRRVRFAPEDKLCSFVLIKPYYEMSAEELGDCYDGRFMLKKFTNMKTQEVDWERQFEVFPSDDESAFCEHTYWKFVKHIPAFTEELFFVDEKGERCHPAHWTAFSRGLLSYLRKSGHVPPGFCSWDTYERHLVWYHEFYHTCITWYDHHFCGFPVEPLPQDAEEIGGSFDGADVDANADGKDFGDDKGVDNRPDDFLETEARYDHNFCGFLLEPLPRDVEDKGGRFDGAELDNNANAEGDDDRSVGYHAESFPGTEATVEARGFVGSGVVALSIATLIFEDNEDEDDVAIDTGVEVEDIEDEVVGLGEEVDAVTVLPPTRKLKAFGPCNRTRPYLGRRCKENVQYTK
ncbi:hypothetical protein FisN_7Lu031 [Fistulifera solaris]|uniref:Uncharacterized protein n=1 Tax=Fistulifera solaris TaxID=1519565 RepID=A0A1Z5JCF6_FISSO|nr:hypothetical protein FisN_7Lu031 [Fistulifera solaris]|eukprot:GAX11665.1 hypothetical protein FisN_7Lu031 [Fistulifera solaris]